MAAVKKSPETEPVSSTFACPHCRASLRIAPEHAGRLVSCNRCGGKMNVPAAPAPVPVAPAPVAPAPAPPQQPWPPPSAPSYGPPIPADCPYCHSRLEVAAHRAGAMVTCPDCRGQFQVPAVTAALPPQPGFRCPWCGFSGPPLTHRRIAPAGWAVFIILLLGCVTILFCWIGLLITEDYRVCGGCGARMG
jgi:uncharacterized protein YbaR (Trm112 family)